MPARCCPACLPGAGTGADVPNRTSSLKHVEFVRLEADQVPLWCWWMRMTGWRTASLICQVRPAGFCAHRGQQFPQCPYPRQDPDRRHSRTSKPIVTNLQAELDDLTAKLVDAGIATWAGASSMTSPRASLCAGAPSFWRISPRREDLERIRHLFDDLESKKDLIQLSGTGGTAAMACASISARKTSSSRCPAPR